MGIAVENALGLRQAYVAEYLNDPPTALGQLLFGRPALPGRGQVVTILPGTPLPGP